MSEKILTFIVVIFGLIAVGNALTRSEPVPEPVPEPLVHLYDTTSAAPSLNMLQPVQQSNPPLVTISNISTPPWVDQLPRDEKAQLSNPLGDQHFKDQFSNFKELCYQGVVYIVGSDQYSHGYMSPKIDKRDRLPMTCD